MFVGLTALLPGVSTATLTDLEVHMCFEIGRIYRGDRFTLDEAHQVADGIGLACVAGRAVVMEAMSLIPFAGWLVKPVLAGYIVKRLGEAISFHFESTTASADRGTWRLVIDAEIEEFDAASVEELCEKLRELTANSDLVLTKIDSGSVVLVLEGSMEGFSIIEYLHQTGKLNEVLGRRVKEVRWEGEARVGDEEQLRTAGGPRRRVFYSYAKADEKHRIQLELRLALLKREGLISDWHYRRIEPGMQREVQIHQRLAISDLILLLISPDYIADNYCIDVEMKQALQQQSEGRSRVVPILVRPTDYKSAPFACLQFLPPEDKPIVTWRHRDEAWLKVVDGIRQIVRGFGSREAGRMASEK